MFVIPLTKEKKLSIQKFLDWDKFKNVFYNNIYMKNCKMVIKMPLPLRKGLEDKIKIKKFKLEKYIFLISYD